MMTTTNNISQEIQLVHFIDNAPFPSLYDIAQKFNLSERTASRRIRLLRQEFEVVIDYRTQQKGYTISHWGALEKEFIRGLFND